MTAEKKTFVKQNWMTFANFLILVGILVNLTSWKQKTDDDIEKLKEHTTSETLHMPFDKKIRVFVPRVELDARLEHIEKTLDRIEEKINE